jgi:hypothetical protein
MGIQCLSALKNSFSGEQQGVVNNDKVLNSTFWCTCCRGSTTYEFMKFGEGKSKGKVYHRTGHEGPEGE